MLVLVVGSKLITRKLSTDMRTFALAKPSLEIVVTGIVQQIKEAGLARAAKISRFSRHACFFLSPPRALPQCHSGL